MLYMIRHGQTANNKKMVLQGRSDLSLNETGVRQAREAARQFRERGIRFDKVYSSPLRRARETAQIILEELGQTEETAREGIFVPQIITDDRLMEINYGPYEGLGLENLPPEVLIFFEDFINNPSPKGMERLEEVVQRAGDFLEELRGEPKEHNILLSFHAIIMKGALEYLTPASKGKYWFGFLGNCEVYAAELKDREFSVPGRLFAGVSDGIAESKWKESRRSAEPVRGGRTGA